MSGPFNPNKTGIEGSEYEVSNDTKFYKGGHRRRVVLTLDQSVVDVPVSKEITIHRSQFVSGLSGRHEIPLFFDSEVTFFGNFVNITTFYHHNFH